MYITYMYMYIHNTKCTCTHTVHVHCNRQCEQRLLAIILDGHREVKWDCVTSEAYVFWGCCNQTLKSHQGLPGFVWAFLCTCTHTGVRTMYNHVNVCSSVHINKDWKSRAPYNITDLVVGHSCTPESTYIVHVHVYIHVHIQLLYTDWQYFSTWLVLSPDMSSDLLWEWYRRLYK